MAVEDEELLQRLTKLLGSSGVQLEVVDPRVDPLADPPDEVADLLILRRASVRREDLTRLNRFATEESNPDLMVVTEGADDVDRTRLLSAGVSGILESADSAREIREAVEAIAGSEGAGLRDPSAGRGDSEPRLGDFHSRSPRMRRFLDLVDRVVETDSSLLITGETGVGKERLAQAIHNEGVRRNGPFVSVNCGAIPESLLESELFGHEVGAFTGAERLKRGRFELASGGTIFLDEIGELPLHLQVNLLSVLQRHRLQRVGGEELLDVDVRIMAATNRDLVEEIEKGRFREDLYYRLNVVTLNVPPLREHAEDIPDLVGSFIRHFRGATGREPVEDITSEALDALTAYAWPGNVRQLINAVEHAIVLCRGSRISVEDLPDAIRGSAATIRRSELHQRAVAPPTPLAIDGWLDQPLREARRAVSREFERAYLEALLTRTKGRVGRTAALAGISARSLYDKLKEHGLRKDDYRRG